MVYIYLLLTLSAIIIIGITNNPITILCGIPWIIIWIVIFQKYGGFHTINNQNHPIEIKIINEHSKSRNQLLSPEEAVQQVIKKIKQHKNILQIIGYILIAIIAGVIMFLGE